MLSKISPLQDDEEDVSYDLELAFKNIPTKEIINYIMVPINSTVIGRTQNYLGHRPKFRNAINEIQSMVIFIVQKDHHQTLTKKSL